MGHPLHVTCRWCPPRGVVICRLLLRALFEREPILYETMVSPVADSEKQGVQMVLSDWKNMLGASTNRQSVDDRAAYACFSVIFQFTMARFVAVLLGISYNLRNA